LFVLIELAERVPAVPRGGNKWVGLAVFTPVLFGYAISENRRLHGKPLFWAIVLTLLIRRET
jgi:hypothetical protein